MEKLLEKDIQRMMCEWLELNKYFFWRSNNIPVFGRSNDGQKRFRAMPKYTPKGISDIIIIYKGNFIGVEVKRRGNKMSEDQVAFKDNVHKNGGWYVCVETLEALERYLSDVKYLIDNNKVA